VWLSPASPLWVLSFSMLNHHNCACQTARLRSLRTIIIPTFPKSRPSNSNFHVSSCPSQQSTFRRQPHSQASLVHPLLAARKDNIRPRRCRYEKPKMVRSPPSTPQNVISRDGSSCSSGPRHPRHGVRRDAAAAVAVGPSTPCSSSSRAAAGKGGYYSRMTPNFTASIPITSPASASSSRRSPPRRSQARRRSSPSRFSSPRRPVRVPCRRLKLGRAVLSVTGCELAGLVLPVSARGKERDSKWSRNRVQAFCLGLGRAPQ
jgi:hypothetical protein